jgi:hypothetical protein
MTATHETPEPAQQGQARLSPELIGKANDMMYFLTKNAARDSFVDFLENAGLSEEVSGSKSGKTS